MRDGVAHHDMWLNRSRDASRPPHRRTAGAALALLLVSCWPAGCGGSHIEIPRPVDATKPAPSPPPVEPSVVHLNVSVPIGDLVAVADQAIPHSSGREDAWQQGQTLTGQAKLEYQYWIVRGPLYVTAMEDRLLAELPDVQYRIALRMRQASGMALEGRCGYGNDPPKRLRLIARSRLSWTDHWTVTSDTMFDPPEFRDACKLDNLDTDVTPIVRSVVETRLPALAAAIDRKVKESSESRQRAQKVWSALQTPLELAPGREIVLNPQDVQVGPIVPNGPFIQSSLNLILKPEIRAASMQPVDHRPLPPLRLASTSLDGFHLVVPIFVEYAMINRRLQERLVGREFESALGGPITVTSANLYGSGGRFIVELGVTGAMNGKLYATGRPRYDNKTGILRFDNFDYTTDTRNMVVHAADSMFHQTFLEQIEPETRIALSDRIESLRARLSSLLTRELEPDLWLEGTVTKLNVLGIYPVAGGVEVQVVANGSLQLSAQ